jgi:hypothetical protein
MNEPNPSSILSKNPLLNAMLGDPIEFPAAIQDVVLFSTGNILIVLKEWGRIKKLASVIILVFGKENLV